MVLETLHDNLQFYVTFTKKIPWHTFICSWANFGRTKQRKKWLRSMQHQSSEKFAGYFDNFPPIFDKCLVSRNFIPDLRKKASQKNERQSQHHKSLSSSFALEKPTLCTADNTFWPIISATKENTCSSYYWLF